MTTVADRKRQPAGITTGGQFATEPRTETQVSLTESVPTCELCQSPAAVAVQAHTSRGPAGQPSYACNLHRYAPTFTTFGGGWYERTDLPTTTPDYGEEMEHTDRLAASAADVATQLAIARSGDTAQREMLLTNQNLTPEAIAWIVDNTEFNPAYADEFAKHPNMTPDLRARIRTW